MFNEQTILEQLRSGVSADELAQKFTEALNAANAAKTAEDEKNKNEATKLADTQELLEHLLTYLDVWYPDLPTGSLNDNDPKDFIAMLDTLATLPDMLADMFAVPEKKTTIKRPRRREDPISEFLRVFVDNG